MSAPTLFATEAISVSVAWTNLLQLGCLGLLAWYGWGTVLRRRAAGLEILPETPHRLVPWDGGLTLASALLYFGLAQIGGVILTQIVFELNDPSAAPLNAEVQTKTNPQWMIALFQANSLLSYISVAVVAALLVAAARARADDFGLALADWRRYLKIGVAGFAVLLPPVMLLQVVLNAVWMDSQHPIIVAYRASRDPRLLLWCTVAAVFVAPFVEEFFFRGILQGWLERLIAKGREAQMSELAASDETAIEVRTPDRSPAPILFTATLFALMHLGSGPDVIPLFFLALGLGYLYRQTHSIWPGFIVHTLLNAWSMVALVLMP